MASRGISTFFVYVSVYTHILLMSFSLSGAAAVEAAQSHFAVRRREHP